MKLEELKTKCKNRVRLKLSWEALAEILKLQDLPIRISVDNATEVIYLDFDTFDAITSPTSEWSTIREIAYAGNEKLKRDDTQDGRFPPGSSFNK